MSNRNARSKIGPVPILVALFGAFVGFLIGVESEMFLAFPRSGQQATYYILEFESGVRLPLIGPCVGMLVFAILSVVIGQWRLPDWFRNVMLGALIGFVLCGLVGGRVIYPEIVLPTELRRDATETISEALEAKERMGHRIAVETQALRVGSLIGVVLGVMGGLAVHCVQHVTARETGASDSRAEG